MSQRAVLIGDHQSETVHMTISQATLPAGAFFYQHSTSTLTMRFERDFHHNWKDLRIGALTIHLFAAADPNLVDVVCTSLLILPVSRLSWPHPIILSSSLWQTWISSNFKLNTFAILLRNNAYRTGWEVLALKRVGHDSKGNLQGLVILPSRCPLVALTHPLRMQSLLL